MLLMGMGFKNIKPMLRILFCFLLIASLQSCQETKEATPTIDADPTGTSGIVENDQQKIFSSYQEADKELNRVYQQILSDYRLDTEFIRNLKKSQQVWITFRDAELEMKYPQRQAGYYGSSHPQCRSIYLHHLTEQRLRTLRQWLVAEEEGDVCAGSVKTN